MEHIQALQEMEAKLNKWFGEGTVKRASALPELKNNVISTGIKELDRALGIGGIPAGRVTEIYGHEMTGKTALALNIAAQAQKKGAVLYIDADGGLSPYLMQKNGVKKKNFYVAKPETMEEAFELCRTAAVGFRLIVIDTIAALSPEGEIVAEMGEHTQELQSVLISKFMRMMVPVLSDTGCALLLVNQTRIKLGIIFGDPAKAVCGRALKYYAAARIETRRTALRSGELGFQYIVSKNKCAVPGKCADVRVVF